MFKIPPRVISPLPVPGLKEPIIRWSMKNKAILLRHLDGQDKAFVDTVLKHYNISVEEHVQWRKAYYHPQGGIMSLRASYRPELPDAETTS